MFIDEDGKEYDLNDDAVFRKLRLKIRCYKQFDGSNRLFNHCWRFFWKEFDSPSDFIYLTEALDSIASAQVNDPESSFYIYGE